MKDIVTFETAVRLKEAGFPQPTPEAGQWWYNENGRLSIIGPLELPERQYFHCMEMESGKTQRVIPSANNVFAPTATDILREIPTYFLWKYKTEDMWGLSLSVWYDYIQKSNPAEAAAEAWLKLHDKK